MGYLGEHMNTKQAVISVLKETKRSKYWLAKQLGVQPIMISNYIRERKPSRMSKPTADTFEQLFGITIDDVYNPIKPLEE